MKEKYFTDSTVELCSRSMMEELRQLKLTRDEPLELGDSALIIIDMQRFFLEESSHAFIPSAGAITGRLERLADLFTERGMPVYLTRHVNSAGEGGMMEKWWGELIEEKDPLSEICAELEKKGETIKKAGYDAFFRTGLEQILKERGVRRVVITGVMTHICCTATALSAFAAGFGVIFPVDGTATSNRLFHEAALLNLAHSCARMVTVNQVAEAMEPG